MHKLSRTVKNAHNIFNTLTTFHYFIYQYASYFSFIDSKFLITTGYETVYTGKSEVIDLSVSGNYECPDWTEYPIYVQGATGGLLGTTPVVCGGGPPVTNKCYKMAGNKVYHIVSMTTERRFASSVTIDDRILWITGGLDDNNNLLSSSEFVQLDGSTKGPDLPIAIIEHAMININNDQIIIIGGLPE